VAETGDETGLRALVDRLVIESPIAAHTLKNPSLLKR
jgi:hypothetical protein